MNFLEQLTTEWYSYNDYIVQTNKRFGPRKQGGYEGEMDVVAYHPQSKVFVHIETSTDSYSWAKRQRHFESKFARAQKYYSQIFPFEYSSIKKIVIVGLRKNTPSHISFGKDVDLLTIPTFVNNITDELKHLSPLKQAVPENLPLVRVLQISSFYRI